MIGVSPAPADVTSRRSISTTSIGGTSANRGTRYCRIVPFRTRPSAKSIASNNAPPIPWTTAPATW